MFFDIYSWGLQIIKAMQSVSTPALNELVKIFTNIGSTYFYLAILCALYWCVDQKRGFKFTYIMLLSTGVNLIIKNALKVLRPYQIDKSVKIIEESEYSTPSGHAQSSACFWQLFMFDFARQFGKKWKNIAWILAIFMPLLIGLSRIYLGVHFPSDVFLGWFLGAVFAIIGLFIVPKLSEFIKKLPQSPKILCCAILPFTMLAINKNLTTIPGMMFGIGVGYVYLENFGGFNAKQGKIWQKILRFLIGMLGAFLIMQVFKMPSKSNEYYNLLHFIKYAIIGIWCSFIAPMLFIFLKFAKKLQIETEN